EGQLGHQPGRPAHYRGLPPHAGHPARPHGTELHERGAAAGAEAGATASSGNALTSALRPGGLWPSSRTRWNIDGKSRGPTHAFVATASATLELSEKQCAYLRPWQRVCGYPLLKGILEARGTWCFQQLAALLSRSFSEAHARPRGVQYMVRQRRVAGHRVPVGGVQRRA